MLPSSHPQSSQTHRPKPRWARTSALLGLSFGFVIFSGFKAPSKSVVPVPAKIPALSADTLKNWGIINVNKTAKSHISALEAWKLQEGSRSVTVAVIDTGLDTN